MKHFRTYQLAIQFYRNTQHLKLPSHLRDQYLRAASSIALNLAEGYGKQTAPDQRKFFSIAFGSAKECQAILALAESGEVRWELDVLNAHIYKLIKGTK